MSTTKHLKRSRNDRMIAGVMGGLGEYFAIDSTVLRLAYVGLTVLTGGVPGIIIYLIAIFLVPADAEGPHVREAKTSHTSSREPGQ